MKYLDAMENDRESLSWQLIPITQTGPQCYICHWHQFILIKQLQQLLLTNNNAIIYKIIKYSRLPLLLYPLFLFSPLFPSPPSLSLSLSSFVYLIRERQDVRMRSIIINQFGEESDIIISISGEIEGVPTIREKSNDSLQH